MTRDRLREAVAREIEGGVLPAHARDMVVAREFFTDEHDLRWLARFAHEEQTHGLPAVDDYVGSLLGYPVKTISRLST